MAKSNLKTLIITLLTFSVLNSAPAFADSTIKNSSVSISSSAKVTSNSSTIKPSQKIDPSMAELINIAQLLADIANNPNVKPTIAQKAQANTFSAKYPLTTIRSMRNPNTGQIIAEEVANKKNILCISPDVKSNFNKLAVIPNVSCTQELNTLKPLLIAHAADINLLTSFASKTINVLLAKNKNAKMSDLITYAKSLPSPTGLTLHYDGGFLILVSNKYGHFVKIGMKNNSIQILATN